MDSVITDGFKQKILPKAYYVGDRKLIDIRNYIDEQEIDAFHKKHRNLKFYVIGRSPADPGCSASSSGRLRP